MKDLTELAEMRDLTELAIDREFLLNTGFEMNDQDDTKQDRNPRYSRKGISEYTRITSSANPGYVLGRKIR